MIPGEGRVVQGVTAAGRSACTRAVRRSTSVAVRAAAQSPLLGAEPGLAEWEGQQVPVCSPLLEPWEPCSPSHPEPAPASSRFWSQFWQSHDVEQPSPQAWSEQRLSVQALSVQALSEQPAADAALALQSGQLSAS